MKPAERDLFMSVKNILIITIFVASLTTGCSHNRNVIHNLDKLSPVNNADPIGYSLNDFENEGIVLFTSKRLAVNVNIECIAEYAQGEEEEDDRLYSIKDKFQPSWAHFLFFF